MQNEVAPTLRAMRYDHMERAACHAICRTCYYRHYEEIKPIVPYALICKLLSMLTTEGRGGGAGRGLKDQGIYLCSIFIATIIHP